MFHFALEESNQQLSYIGLKVISVMTLLESCTMTVTMEYSIKSDVKLADEFVCCIEEWRNAQEVEEENLYKLNNKTAEKLG